MGHRLTEHWPVVEGGKVAIAAVVAYWAGMGAAVKTLLLLQGLDISTGIAYAVFAQQLNSKSASKGIAIKIGMWIAIAAMHVISDQADNLHGAPIPFDLGDATAWYCVLAEWISVTENCVKLGVPVPRQVVSLLKYAKKLQGPEEIAVVAQEKAKEAVSDAKQAQESAKEAQKATEALVDSATEAQPIVPEVK